MKKIYLLVFLSSVLMFSCVAAPENIAGTALPTVTAPVVAATPAETVPTAAAKLIPKHNDLIFVEFFAVT